MNMKKPLFIVSLLACLFSGEVVAQDSCYDYYGSIIKDSSGAIYTWSGTNWVQTAIVYNPWMSDEYNQPYYNVISGQPVQCPGTSSGGQNMADAVFDYVETQYSQYFYPATYSSTADPYYYRYYSGTNSYLVAYQGNLWYNIGDTGWNNAGSLSSWY